MLYVIPTIANNQLPLTSAEYTTPITKTYTIAWNICDLESFFPLLIWLAKILTASIKGIPALIYVLN